MTDTKFWDRIAEKYSKQPVADQASYEKKLEVTRSYFTPETEVMEFGCGTGSTAIAHAPHVKHVLATDVSQNMVDIAREKAAAANVGNVTFERATLDDMDLPDGSLDVVLGLSILHLLEDKEAAIAKVYRLLKAGGVFVSSTVCLGDNMRWFRFVGPIGRWLGFMPYVSVFTSQELVDSMKAAGFGVDYEWRPPGGRVLFLVAKKPG
ncbi:MAG: class I SAM-dependent methyltransferase [Woeseiaceae bacterium]|nr:class I SAM-dependent methyltransferase [Woeseiaceae bacterium]